MKLDKNKWTYYSPTFEFAKEIPLSIEFSPWGGHSFFAYDLVANIKPKTIVELGTFKGNSLFAFSQAVKDFNLNTKINAVDTWKGDAHSGFYKNDVYNLFEKVKNEYYQDLNIIEHKMFFDDAVIEFKNNSIDILHIDGLHTYETVKHDFETWLPKVKKNTGIIIFHDICETNVDFGVYKLWDEIKKEYKNTITFEHYHGLGVIFLDNNMRDLKTNFVKYYRVISDNQELEHSLQQSQKENIELKKTITKKNEILGEKDEILAEREEILGEKEKIIKDKNRVLEEYKTEIEEFNSFKKGLIWRILEKYRKIKKALRR